MRFGLFRGKAQFIVGKRILNLLEPVIPFIQPLFAVDFTLLLQIRDLVLNACFHCRNTVRHGCEHAEQLILHTADIERLAHGIGPVEQEHSEHADADPQNIAFGNAAQHFVNAWMDDIDKSDGKNTPVHSVLQAHTATDVEKFIGIIPPPGVKQLFHQEARQIFHDVAK